MVKNSPGHTQRFGEPKAVTVTFLATFVTIIVTYALYMFDSSIRDYISSEKVIQARGDFWILGLVALIVGRHNLRVFFIDSVYSGKGERRDEQRWLFVLFLIAIMGGSVFLIFGYGLVVGSIFMVAYSFLSIILFVLLLLGQAMSRNSSDEPERPQSVALSAIIDVICMVGWGWVIIELIIGLPSASDSRYFAVLMIAVFIVTEIKKIFWNAVKERVRAVL